MVIQSKAKDITYVIAFHLLFEIIKMNPYLLEKYIPQMDISSII